MSEEHKLVLRKKVLEGQVIPANFEPEPAQDIAVGRGNTLFKMCEREGCRQFPVISGPVTDKVCTMCFRPIK